MLILVAGLPGTGKTYVAKKLAAALNAVVLSKDTVRHALFPSELIEYSTAQDDFVIDVLLHTADYIWRRHPNQLLILDGRTFSQATQRKHVIDFAETNGHPWRIIECICDEQTAKRRLSKADPQHPAGNRNPTLYDDVKGRWQPLQEERIIVSTDQPIQIDALVARIQ
jgi:predicted kinase